MDQPAQKPNLHFFSYDSMGNPWLGGGGSLRDFELLKRYRPHCNSLTLWVGAYPGCADHVLEGIEIKHLNVFAKKPANEWTSRIQYVHKANQVLKTLRSEWVGLTLSPYAPLKEVAKCPKHFGILHHQMGPKWKEKLPLGGGQIMNFEYRYYQKFQNIICINSAVENLIHNLNPKAAVFRSANACDSKLFALPDHSAIDTPFVLFFGRLERFMKGLDLLVAAFAQAHPKAPAYKLVLAGRADAKQRENMAEVLNRHPGLPVEIVENPSDSQRAELLSQCSFFCSPSRFEGWGIAALEACAAGKAVLVSKAEGFLDSVHEQAGEHVDIEDPNALGEALCRWMQNPSIWQEKKVGARKWAEQFTWDSIAHKEWNWIAEQLGD